MLTVLFYTHYTYKSKDFSSMGYCSKKIGPLCDKVTEGAVRPC